MDSFKVSLRIGAAHCTLDLDTWEIESELGGDGRGRFGDDIDEAMNNIEEEEVVTDGISFEGGAKAELIATMRVKDDLEFGCGGAVSRASGRGFIEKPTEIKILLIFFSVLIHM